MTYRFNDGGHIGFVMGEGTSLNADGTLPYQQQTSRPRAFAGMMEYAPHKNLMFQMGAFARAKHVAGFAGFRFVRYRGRCEPHSWAYKQSNP